MRPIYGLKLSSNVYGYISRIRDEYEFDLISKSEFNVKFMQIIEDYFCIKGQAMPELFSIQGN